MVSTKVSVVITTYNREEYIKYAVDSVLNQTYGDFELLIIDDGSTDNTKNIINSYDDKRIIYHYQENSGQNSARNKGIELAKGEYIAYLDSDDIWIDTKLEKQVNTLEKHRDFGLAYCGSFIIDEHNNVTGKKPLIENNGFILDKLLATNFLYNGSNVLFRKKCIEKVGLFDTSFTRMTDWEFYLRFAIYYKFYGIPEYLLKYRVHTDTMSTDFKSYETCGIAILNKIFNHKHLETRFLKYKDRAFALRYRYLGRRYIENGFSNESRKYFSKALKQDLSSLFSDIPALYMCSFLPSNSRNFIKTVKNELKSKFLNFEN